MQQHAKSTYKHNVIIDQLSMWGFGKAAFHEFYQLDVFTITKVKTYNTLIYKEFFYITTSTHQV